MAFGVWLLGVRILGFAREAQRASGECALEWTRNISKVQGQYLVSGAGQTLSNPSTGARPARELVRKGLVGLKLLH